MENTLITTEAYHIYQRVKNGEMTNGSFRTTKYRLRRDPNPSVKTLNKLINYETASTLLKLESLTPGIIDKLVQAPLTPEELALCKSLLVNHLVDCEVRYHSPFFTVDEKERAEIKEEFQWQVNQGDFNNLLTRETLNSLSQQ